MSRLTKPFKPSKKPKPKICVTCKKEFTPLKIGQVACSPKCAIDYINSPENKIKEKVSRELAKKERAENKKKKEALKPLRKWNSEAQSAINKYVRLRDSDQPCISCGRFVTEKYGGNYDCGHYRTRKAAPHLRFNLNNMARQCVNCNRFASGAQLDFRNGLIRRIGMEKVEEIENNNTAIKFDVEYLKRIKAIFTKKAKKLEKKHERP